MEKSAVLSKFKGSVFAALSGDCIGAIYERNWAPVKLSILQSLEENLKKSGNNVTEVPFIGNSCYFSFVTFSDECHGWQERGCFHSRDCKFMQLYCWLTIRPPF